MNGEVLVDIEEYLNGTGRRVWNPVGESMKYSREVILEIRSQLEESCKEIPKQSTVYQDSIGYLKRMNDPRFMRKNGEVKEATFYRYACIDKSTWSDMKWGKGKISKKTLLKLVLALQLNLDEAEQMLAKGNEQFNPGDIQDRIIQAIICVTPKHSLEVPDIMDILAEYQKMYRNTKPFNSIYETPEMIAERKKRNEVEEKR